MAGNIRWQEKSRKNQIKSRGEFNSSVFHFNNDLAADKNSTSGSWEIDQFITAVVMPWACSIIYHAKCQPKI